MRENGSFKKKTGFTITGNALVRDTRLSLKAKGLYLLIMSYITLDNLDLTKTFLQKKCTEGTKAFSSAWDELKENGYLKVHMMPGKQGWQSEYELLDEPQDGAHSFYHSSSGEITKTNLTISRTNPTSECENQRTPQKGIYADGSNAEGIYAKRSNANGGNNIILSDKTKNNTLDNTQSINQAETPENMDDGLSEDELREIVEDEISLNGAVPYNYKADEKKMQTAIEILVELTSAHFSSDFEKSTLAMLVDCLTEMACAEGIQTYKGSSVSYAKVIDKINEIIKRESSLYHFAEETIDDYISAAKEYEIKDKRKYMKSVIWNSFLTYRVKFESHLTRTHINA